MMPLSQHALLLLRGCGELYVHVSTLVGGPCSDPCKDKSTRAFSGGIENVGKSAQTVEKCAEHCEGKQFMGVQHGSGPHHQNDNNMALTPIG